MNRKKKEKELPPITEKDFSKQVEALLGIFAWRWCHFRPARTEHGWRTAITGDRGFVDYVAVKEGRVIFIELKSEKGRVSTEQQEWLDNLGRCPEVECYLFRPSDFAKIAERLQGR